jgi:hypothetical protein
MQRISLFLRNNRWVVVLSLAMLMSAVSFAQETPVTPSIDLPLDDIFTYLNQWLVVFAPIVLFVGMIPVAMSLLRYITNLLKSAFGGGN